MARKLNDADAYDHWSKIAHTRHHAAKLRERAIACESSGNEFMAARFMSLADIIEDKANHEQLRLAIS